MVYIVVAALLIVIISVLCWSAYVRPERLRFSLKLTRWLHLELEAGKAPPD